MGKERKLLTALIGIAGETFAQSSDLREQTIDGNLKKVFTITISPPLPTKRQPQ